MRASGVKLFVGLVAALLVYGVVKHPVPPSVPARFAELPATPPEFSETRSSGLSLLGATGETAALLGHNSASSTAGTAATVASQYGVSRTTEVEPHRSSPDRSRYRSANRCGKPTRLLCYRASMRLPRRSDA